MDKTDDAHHARARLREEIAALEAQLAAVRASLPAHSLSSAMFQQLDDLECAIEEKRALLGHDKREPDSP